MISKSLSTSERYACLHDVAGKLAEFCQSLFPLLVAHADDWGCLPGDVFTVKHLTHPTSPRKLPEFETALAALHAVGLIQWYETDGKRVVFIRQWFAHQQLKGHDKDGRKRTFPLPPENPNDSAVSAQSRPSSPKSALREEKRTEEKRTELKGREGNGADAPAPLSKVPVDTDPAAPECKVEAVVQLWNEIVADSQLPQCRGISETRRTHIRARLKEHGLGVLRDVFERVAKSDFANGQNDRTWLMSFDWLMESPNNFLKAMEGRYDNRAALKATGTEGRGRTGAPPKGKYDDFTGEGE
jgi:hypothetical protein